MNSWEIIKEHMTKPFYKEGTFGRMMQINNASDLFVAIKDNLSDKEDAISSFNTDPEILPAIEARGLENELREVGVIR